jgi:hypothetical protein
MPTGMHLQENEQVGKYRGVPACPVVNTGKGEELL